MYNIVLKKTDSHNNGLEGVGFRLKENDGVIREASSGKDGTVIFKGLSYGSYTLSEEQAPSGYLKGNQVWKYKIPENAPNTLNGKLIVDREHQMPTYVLWTEGENDQGQKKKNVSVVNESVPVIYAEK